MRVNKILEFRYGVSIQPYENPETERRIAIFLKTVEL